MQMLACALHVYKIFNVNLYLCMLTALHVHVHVHVHAARSVHVQQNFYYSWNQIKCAK